MTNKLETRFGVEISAIIVPQLMAGAVSFPAARLVPRIRREYTTLYTVFMRAIWPSPFQLH